ncbi:hypothetical protein ONZ45_g4901 [Pleurotus djamor]|nr:hypothetical protein ONZ45_g4901 [Pleurotus djamor]
MSHSASQADRSRPIQTPASLDGPTSRRATSPPPVKPVVVTAEAPVKPLVAEADVPLSSPKPKATIPSSHIPEPSVVDDATSSDDGDDDIPSDIIDRMIFQQILDLDDSDSKEFSFEMTAAYIVQAGETFDNMDAALSKKDLVELSRLGHYLKGSSAAIGIWRVQASCERIQHYGQLRDEESGGVTLSVADALSKIKETIEQTKKENAQAEVWLREYYKDEFAA